MALDMMLGQTVSYILKRRDHRFWITLMCYFDFEVMNTYKAMGFKAIVDVLWGFVKFV